MLGISNQNLRVIKQVLPFPMMWITFGILYIMIEKGLIGNAEYYPSTGNVYSFKYSLIFVPIGCLFIGILLGFAEILYLKNLFSKRSFIEKIISKTVLYTSFIGLWLILLSLLSLSTIHKSPVYSAVVIDNLINFLANFAFFSAMLYAGVLNALALFISDISRYVGQGVFVNFLVGRYHRPIREERIFMFLDMNASTTHAERLGHETYFELLRKYYAVMSKAIVNTTAEIYQYVGDEIILTWQLKGQASNKQCIDCFYQIKKAFEKEKKAFVSAFGFLPSFKAGVHCGFVTTGEIGVIKKEILYTGDVLNTTARIQGLCNELGHELLISDTLKNKLAGEKSFDFILIGSTSLKGKDAVHDLYGISSDR